MLSLRPPRFRRVLRRAVIAAATVTAGVATAVAADSADLTRVRSSHAYIRAMIEEAAQRSPTFRRLIASIAATDGIVYVEQGACGHSVRACLAMHVTPTASYRFLRVLVDPRQPDWDVMASIGHELQHALEVLGNPTVTTAEKILLFYLGEATMGDSFETNAAVRVGNAVRHEVGSYARGKLN